MDRRKEELIAAVERCKAALEKNKMINGVVKLNGSYAYRFAGQEHPGWRKPVKKAYILKNA